MSDSVMTGPIRVLVVEDSEDQSALLRQNFERAGCIVTTVENAEQAIEAYRADPPELAVIDLVLPGMDGWELVERVRADLPDCAIAITSVLDAADFPAAEAILPKPFTGAEIRQVLKDTVPRWGS
ncbi:MAG: response regulator [Salinibacterium sp.]|nr:MAG: response regulator [Salinibacterium sp.]